MSSDTTQAPPSINDNAFWIADSDLALLRRAGRAQLSKSFDPKFTAADKARLISLCAGDR